MFLYLYIFIISELGNYILALLGLALPRFFRKLDLSPRPHLNLCFPSQLHNNINIKSFLHPATHVHCLLPPPVTPAIPPLFSPSRGGLHRMNLILWNRFPRHYMLQSLWSTDTRFFSGSVLQYYDRLSSSRLSCGLGRGQPFRTVMSCRLFRVLGRPNIHPCCVSHLSSFLPHFLCIFFAL